MSDGNSGFKSFLLSRYVTTWLPRRCKCRCFFYRFNFLTIGGSKKHLEYPNIVQKLCEVAHTSIRLKRDKYGAGIPADIARGTFVSEFLYDAFISYRRSDGGSVARWLRRELEAFRPPRSLRDRLPQRLRIYLDTAYERGAADFFENTIKPALLASRFLIVVATPDAALRGSGGDDWIAREIDEFTCGPNGQNLLLVRGAGAFGGPLPGDLSRCFPHIEIVDLRDVGRFWYLNLLRASRIADEKLKLIAPVAGVAAQDMPALRREQERIQQSRIGAAAGVSLALLVTISSLTTYALISRYQATTALESTLAATASLVLRLGGSDDTGAFSNEARKSFLNDACDLFDGLRTKASTDASARPLVICSGQRADDYEQLHEIDKARQFLQKAVVEAIAIHTRSHVPDDARSVVIALDQLCDFFERQGDAKTLVASLEKSDSTIAALQSDHPDQSFFPESRALRLQRMAGIYERQRQASEQLEALDKAAALAGTAAQKQIGEKQSRLLAFKARLLMAAAEVASRVVDADAALARLNEAVAAMDTAAKSSKSAGSENSLDQAAIFAMIAAVETSRGNNEVAGQARAEGRRRLDGLFISTRDVAEQERLERIRHALDDVGNADMPARSARP